MADHGHVVGLHDEVLQPVEHAATRGRHAAVDAALVDGLAGDTGVRVNVQMTCNTRSHTVTHCNTRSHSHTLCNTRNGAECCRKTSSL